MSTAADPFYKKLSYNLLSVALVVLLLYVAQGILIPIFIAILLAILLLPIVKILLHFKVNYILSILITLFLAIIVIGVILYFLSSQIANFFEDLPAIKERFGELITTLKAWVKEHLNIAP